MLNPSKPCRINHNPENISAILSWSEKTKNGRKKLNINEVGHIQNYTHLYWHNITLENILWDEIVGHRALVIVTMYAHQGIERHVVLSVTNVYTAAISTDIASG